MDIGSAIVFALIAMQTAGWTALYGPALAYHYIQRSIHLWYSELRSASRLRKSQAISVGAIIAMHVVVLGSLMAGVDLPALLAVTAAIVIMTGWAVIACAAVARSANSAPPSVQTSR